MARVAILIDGGFLLKRLPTVRDDIDATNPREVVRAIEQLINSHLRQVNNHENVPNPYSLLYRCFFYDARPYDKKGHRPISKSAIDYSRSTEAIFRNGLFDALRKRPNFAVRLGIVRRERSWIIREEAQKELLAKRRAVDELTDEDFVPGFR